MTETVVAMAFRDMVQGNACAPDGMAVSNPLGGLANTVLGTRGKAQVRACTVSFSSRLLLQT